eukprot:85483-Rhodomonas_salina.2
MLGGNHLPCERASGKPGITVVEVKGGALVDSTCESGQVEHRPLHRVCRDRERRTKGHANAVE